MDKFGDTKPTLDTCLSMISRTIRVRPGCYNLFVLHFQFELTSDTAVRTDCSDGTVRPGNTSGGHVSEGSCRAGINAGTAELTPSIAKCPSLQRGNCMTLETASSFTNRRLPIHTLLHFGKTLDTCFGWKVRYSAQLLFGTHIFGPNYCFFGRYKAFRNVSRAPKITINGLSCLSPCGDGIDDQRRPALAITSGKDTPATST